MPENTHDVILHIAMSEQPNYSGTLRGAFRASLQRVNPKATWDDDPTTYLCAYQHPLTGFGMSAWYGEPELNDYRHYGFDYGFEPEERLLKAPELDRLRAALKKADAGYTKFEKAYGSPQTLGQKVVAYMGALGLTRACWKLEDGVDGYGEHRGWRLATTMEEVRYYIDGRIEAVRTAQLAEKAAQAA